MNLPSLRLRTSVLATIVGALVLLAPIRADAANDLIGFNTLAGGTVITDQLMSQGIEFGSPNTFGVYPGSLRSGKCPEEQVVTSGSPNTIRPTMCPYMVKEFPTPGYFSMFRLTTTRNFVSFGVRALGTTSLGGFDATSFDVDGNVLQTLHSNDTTTNLTFNNTNNVIAYIHVFNGVPWELSPITVNHLDTPPTPFVRVAPIAGVTMGQTGVAETKVRINRWNGSIGPVALSIAPTGALAGASFTPQVLNGTAQSAQVRVTGGDANPADYTTIVRATPQSAAAGNVAAGQSLAIHLEPRVTLSGYRWPDVSLQPCSTAMIGRGSLTWGTGVTPKGPVTTSYRASLNNNSRTRVVSTGSFGNEPMIYVPNPADDLPPGELQGEITTEFLEGGTPIPGTQVTSKVYTAAPTFGVYGEGSKPAYGYTPGPDAPDGTRMIVIGAICPGAKVVVGNAQAIAPVEVTGINSGSGDAKGYFNVPRNATSGKVALLNPKTAARVGTIGGDYATKLPMSEKPLKVFDLRDSLAFAWDDLKVGAGRKVSFDLLKMAYGDQVVTGVDVCASLTLNIVECKASLGVPTTSAAAFILLGPDLDRGVSWGYSRVAADLQSYPDQWKLYNSGPWVEHGPNSLLGNGFAGPSGDLADKILAKQLLRYSAQNSIRSDYMRTTAEVISTYRELTKHGSNQLPLILTKHDGVERSMLAVDMQVAADGSVTLWVMQPGVPVTPQESDPDGVAHAKAHTAIHITPDGLWGMETTSLTNQGMLNDLAESSLQMRSNWAYFSEDTWMAGIGGRWWLPNILRVAAGEAHRARSMKSEGPIALTAASPLAMWMGGGGVVGAKATAPGAGATASLAGDGINVSGSAGGVTLVASTDKQAVLVSLGATSKSDTLAPKAGSLVLTHQGSKTTATITSYAKGITSSSKAIKLTSGAKVTVKGSRLLVKTKGKTKKIKLKGSYMGSAPKVGKAVVKATSKGKGHAVTVSVPVTVPAGSTGAVAWQVVNKSGKIVAKGGGLVTEGVSTSTGRIKAPSGKYKVKISASIFNPQIGLGGASKPATISKRIQLR